MSVLLYINSLSTLLSIELTGDVIALSSDSSIVLQASVKSVYQLALLQILDLQQQYITTINGKLPDLTGTLLMLGSLCISVVDRTDVTDTLSTPSDSHTLVIFDGCKACNDCDSVWLVMQTLKLCHIWAIGLKDCILYYLPAAAGMWDKLMQSRITVLDQDQTYITDQTGSCLYKAQLIASDRSVLLKRATKLLYQYKAVVAMWNYLVYNMAARMHVLTTQLDYTGISVRIKRRFNLCQVNASSVRLVVHALRTGQATSGYIRLSSDSASLAIPYAAAFCVQPMQLNTYIEYNTDKGRSVDNTNVVMYSDSASSIVASTDITHTSNSSTIDTIVLYTLQRDAGQIVCSALLKILPVFVSLTQPRTANLTLALYVSHRARNGTYKDDLLLMTNRWYILTLWICTGLPNLSDGVYYNTPYNIYPTKVLLPE